MTFAGSFAPSHQQGAHSQTGQWRPGRSLCFFRLGIGCSDGRAGLQGKGRVKVKAKMWKGGLRGDPEGRKSGSLYTRRQPAGKISAKRPRGRQRSRIFARRVDVSKVCASGDRGTMAVLMPGCLSALGPKTEATRSG